MLVEEKNISEEEDFSRESLRPEIVARGILLRDNPNYLGEGFANRMATLLFEEWELLSEPF